MSGLVFSDERERLQIDRVLRWLASSYWSPGIERGVVERAIAGSHPLGVYDRDVQVGFARMITDRATFAWLADVWVDEGRRGEAIGRRMVQWFLDHPDYTGIRRFALVTLDAHGVYDALGFHAPIRPQNYMERLHRDAAARLRVTP